MTTRRAFLQVAATIAGSAVLPGIEGRASNPRARVFTPEMFGAKGDGTTNDSDALAALGTAVSANGGGIVRFRRATYRVGRQTPTGDAEAPYSFAPAKLLEISGCRDPVTILGNGARIVCEPGLRYGIFRPDGTPAPHGGAYIGPGIATPYQYMLKVEGCTGPVEIRDLELDGNVSTLVIGGTYGDTGWQIPAIGLALVDNAGPELVRNLHCHHHAEDGLLINGIDTATAEPVARRIVSVRCEGNGRQGCSIVGGRGYRFDRCSFSRTGRAGLSSMPGAGFDIEAEGVKTVRDLRFADCDFSDNVGCGLVADTGDSEGAEFARCTFVGTTSWSAWPNKPHFTFRDCSFVGPLVRAYGDADAARSTRFIDCIFTDDPALSPTGRIYGGENPDRPLADLYDTRNVLFRGCRFEATHEGTLPWSMHVIYENCRMRQRRPEISKPRGTYLGRNVIEGRANLTGSTIVGEVRLNGRVHAATRL